MPTNLAALRFSVAQSVGDATDADAARRAHDYADDAILEAPGRARWACAAGCAACCHLLVHVKPAEVARIRAFVDETFTEDARAALARRVREIARQVEGLDAGSYRRARVRCAFLDPDDHCQVYPVRPVKCRAHASPSAAACADVHGPVPLDAWAVKVGEAVHAGMGEASTAELHRAFDSY